MVTDIQDGDSGSSGFWLDHLMMIQRMFTIYGTIIRNLRSLEPVSSSIGQIMSESLGVVSQKRKDLEEEVPEVEEVKTRKRKNVSRKEFLGDCLNQIEMLDPKKYETDYYFEGCLRKVYPYYFQYKSFCRKRWIGRKLVDVIIDEFRYMKIENLLRKIRNGDIQINEKIVSADYILVDLDRLTSRVHRHELPVLGVDIKIIHEDENFLVVDKPPSLPVHPCGRYRFNTVTALLHTTMGYKQLHITHRLDRLTSGVLILAKNKQTAQKMFQEISGREVQKEYLCRVHGDFPEGDILVDKPLEHVCPKTGLSIVSTSPEAKESQTIFKKLSFNGKSSLIHCFPKTGRTHQIRVHLQYLGYPIINDPLYNSAAFGPMKGKDGNYNGQTMEELKEVLRKEHNIMDWSATDDWVDDGKDAETDDSTKTFVGMDFQPKEPGFEPIKMTFDPGCEECQVSQKSPKAKFLMQFLHAYKYTGPSWSFQSEKPFWAVEGYDAL